MTRNKRLAQQRLRDRLLADIRARCPTTWQGRRIRQGPWDGSLTRNPLANVVLSIQVKNRYDPGVLQALLQTGHPCSTDERAALLQSSGLILCASDRNAIARWLEQHGIADAEELFRAQVRWQYRDDQVPPSRVSWHCRTADSSAPEVDLRGLEELAVAQQNPMVANLDELATLTGQLLRCEVQAQEVAGEHDGLSGWCRLDHCLSDLTPQDRWRPHHPEPVPELYAKSLFQGGWSTIARSRTIQDWQQRLGALLTQQHRPPSQHIAAVAICLWLQVQQSSIRHLGCGQPIIDCLQRLRAQGHDPALSTLVPHLLNWEYRLRGIGVSGFTVPIWQSLMTK